MTNIAIVEDEEEFALALEKYLKRYGEENGTVFKIRRFVNALALLENYSADYDVIFMDIKMPYLNGMDAAHRLRELDANVLLIFVTNMTQYAVNGYEVDALDYIVKPVNYYDFALKLTRAVNRLRAKDETFITVPVSSGMIRLKPEQIRYVETQGHHVVYHTGKEDYSQYCSLKDAESKLKGYGFARCNSCYLVNLRYVKSVKGHVVNVDGTELQISQPKRKDFVQKLMAYTEGKEV